MGEETGARQQEQLVRRCSPHRKERTGSSRSTTEPQGISWLATQ